jgi:phospholipase C
VKYGRREFIRLTAATGGAAALSALPISVRKALATPAANSTRSIRDVRHIVILMQENRSFDHYFGTLRGVRGFGDPHPIPLPNGKPVWHQSDGEREVLPFHLNTSTTNALRVPVTPHTFADAQAAWDQGRLAHWPRFKTPYSMGYYRREDLPFQFALADAFTICDAYHCSVTTGTDPNRIVFFSGSNFDPALRARGINCTDADSEPDNLRCWIKGTLPSPGYTYAGSALQWPTLPEVLERAGVDWRIYQDPNNNWTGAMHGGLAFAGFRNAKPGSAVYEKGMRHWSLQHLAEDVRKGTLPQVSWILPPQEWSEHPLPSTPLHGAQFTLRVLQTLMSNPDVWSRTAFFLTFDENDGQFDHVPPPAPPSLESDGRFAGKSTLDLGGMYFSDPAGKYLHAGDPYRNAIRPWGLGPRVPMYVISPWSRGGYVCSQVFDHTSVGRFLERRFGIEIPAISPWHRAVCGDLTTAFDFDTPNEPDAVRLPSVGDVSSIALEHAQRPHVLPPDHPQLPVQEPGTRPSRALPYRLHARVRSSANRLSLVLRNDGDAGAVFHVYDKLDLQRLPRRYTVEAGRQLTDSWQAPESGRGHDLAIYGPGNFFQAFRRDPD